MFAIVGAQFSCCVWAVGDFLVSENACDVLDMRVSLVSKRPHSSIMRNIWLCMRSMAGKQLLAAQASLLNCEACIPTSKQLLTEHGPHLPLRNLVSRQHEPYHSNDENGDFGRRNDHR